LASLHFDAAEYSQAVRYARLAAERGGRKSERWLLLGDAYFKVLRYEDAQSAYGQAKRLGSRSARGRIEKVRRTVGRVR
jgi:cytochrome c-type biogenesis protein CcmH/NrfG